MIVKYYFLSGYMKKIGKALLEAYPNAIINSHPALLPKIWWSGDVWKFVHEAY